MKRILNIISVALLLMFVASCGRKMGFEYTSYVSLENVSYSVDEDVELLYIPVKVYNSNGGEVQVKVSTEDGKAKEGTNYSIVSPVSGILSLAAGEEEGVIVVEIVNIDDPDPDGTLDFSVKISSVEGSSTPVGGCNKAQVRINDLNHPLRAFIGTWSGSITEYQGAPTPITISILPFENDNTFNKLMIYDLDPYWASTGYSAEKGFNIVQAVGNPDKKSIVVEPEQIIVDDPDAELVMMLYSFDLKPDGIYMGNNITLAINEDGTLTIKNAYGCINNADGYIYSLYEAGAVLTKK